MIKNNARKEEGKMKIFYSSTFMKKEDLEKAGIDYPIQLEYYKIINEDQLIRKEKAIYGMNVIKSEYRKEGTKIENKEITYISNDEKEIEEILNLLKENEVTPVIVEDVLNDFQRKNLQIVGN